MRVGSMKDKRRRGKSLWSIDILIECWEADGTGRNDHRRCY